MPYKRTPSICAVCRSPYMARPQSIACSAPCAYTVIRLRTDTEVAAKIDRNGPLPAHRPQFGVCWVYTGRTNHGGYGFLHRRDEECLTHRRAWIEVTGDALTTDDVIGHICDNPPCVRNDDVGVYVINGITLPRRGHLFRGIAANNVADKIEKGRQPPRIVRPESVLRGEAVSNAKLTDQIVREIRRRYAAGGISMQHLAREYGVGAMTIHRAIRGHTWRHLG